MSLLLVALVFLVSANSGMERDALRPPRISPGRIQVGAFYNGVMVDVRGELEGGASAIVTVVGSDKEEQFNRKRRFGPIWLNSGKVRVSGVPSLFLCYSAAPLGAVLSRDAILRFGLDRESLVRRMPRALDSRIRADYFALKQEDGVYAFGQTVRLTGSGSGAAYHVRFPWPKKAPPARYEVRVYEVRDGAILRQASAPLEVVRTGFPAWLAGVAHNRASLYGMAAVLAGALAGFGIDMLATRAFGKRRQAIH